jgi:signal transduction histidine kinase
MSLRERTKRWGDLVLALALLVELEYEIWIRPPAGLTVHGGRPAINVLVALVSLPLAWRQRAPIAVVATSGAAVVLGALLTTSANGPPLGAWLALLVGFYSVGAHCQDRRGLIGGGTVLAALVAVDVAAGGIFQAHGSRPGTSLTFAVAYLVGREVRRHRREVALLRDRANRLEEEREERARTAAAEERARIARELHDVVAHSVSVMVVQAQAVQRVLDGEQGPARDLLGSIETTGRQALVELRRLLGLLRHSEEPELAPQPSLRQLDDLIEQVREAGLPVRLLVEGEPAPLAPGIDLSAYRIVQEGLTNALKHAGPAQARVTVRYSPSDLQLEIADDGTGVAGSAGSGEGLLGMRERVALYGGELVSGRGDDGGYVVRARLPLRGSP